MNKIAALAGGLAILGVLALAWMLVELGNDRYDDGRFFQACKERHGNVVALYNGNPVCIRDNTVVLRWEDVIK